MRKGFTKIICSLAASVLILSGGVLAGCKGEFSADKLAGDTAGEVISNGGFAVKKGEYVYFINGDEEYSADNSWGKPVKGAIMRIHEDDLAARNYSACDTVVPLVTYSGNSDCGIFIYGDYVYYSTPSTAKDSDGKVQNTTTTFRRTRLDGTGTSKDPIASYSANGIEYTFATVGDTVYLMYAATSETLYEKSCTNIHSVNCETGEDTVLAYNVQSVAFDKGDVSNPRVYYTMSVPKLGEDSDESYNQIYCVRADDKSANSYDFAAIEDYDAEEDPVYMNNGDLVLDGRGHNDAAGQFNAVKETVANQSINYTLVKYYDGALYYTRTEGDQTAALYTVADSQVADDKLADDVFGNAALENPGIEDAMLNNASADANGRDPSKFNFISKDGKLEKVLVSESGSFTVLVPDESGKLPEAGGDRIADRDFPIPADDEPTFLFTEGDYLYYSTPDHLCRVNFTGSADDYLVMTDGIEGQDEYTSVNILDLNYSSGWYVPELFDGQLLVATEFEDRAEYTYIAACDLRADDGTVMTNAQLKAYTDKFDGIDGEDGLFGKLETENADARNLAQALRYAFVTRADSTLIKEVHAQFAESLGDDYATSESGYTDVTIAEYDKFIEAKDEWSDYAATRKINGEDVRANMRDYYYSVLGKMKESDSDARLEYLETTYIQQLPEEEEQPGWYESLSAGAKAGFIIGMICAGLALIAVVTVIVALIIRAKEKKPVHKERRYKVDITDDKDIDVYGTGETGDGQPEEEPQGGPSDESQPDADAQPDGEPSDGGESD